ncbi:lasso peptide biosynthesis B2 protein [Novosphingobium sp. B 225]|uniref:lasso peptide biosynthesis B2 protein n=1 Tax=Novosphingobium sp. B 225 TaxID=1961849 RepID=UPI000B4A6293|nr:lasso peptide biosynthesis B2 protein [Novosphingobium sp. B 225]
MSRLARLIALPGGQRRLLLAAMAALARAALQVWLVPFPRIAAQLGTMQPPQPVTPANEIEAEQARELRWAIAAVIHYTPLRPACLAQALAARNLCRARGLRWALHLGAAPGQPKGETHAWLDLGGVPITGYPLPADMVEVGCFAGRV